MRILPGCGDNTAPQNPQTAPTGTCVSHTRQVTIGAAGWAADPDVPSALGPVLIG
jgi:hypothetical protein